LIAARFKFGNILYFISFFRDEKSQDSVPENAFFIYLTVHPKPLEEDEAHRPSNNFLISYVVSWVFWILNKLLFLGVGSSK